MWDKIKDFLGGSAGKLITDVGDVVDRFVQSKDEKEKVKQALIRLAHKNEMEAQEFSLKAEHEFNQRIKDMEGTAKDLIQAGWIGRLVLFLRGLQRPLWGYVVGYIDLMVFSGKWALPEGGIESAFWIINFLVLGFLFGERAVKNVGPLIRDMIKK